jgi:hypothetical protein
MADLMMANVDAGTTDEEIKEFLVKYGFPPFDSATRIPGTGSRPAAMLTFKDVPPEALRSLLPRVQDMFWKDRTIHVQVMTEHPD